MTLLKPGFVLNEYIIRRVVDAGGMCNVYEAYTSSESKAVAVKAMHHVWAQDTELRQRFLNEAHLLTTLHHEHLVESLGNGVLPSGEPFMVLKWLPFSLQNILDARKSAFESHVVHRLSGQIARALVFLHEQNIVHRDLKAANVLLDGDDLTRANTRLADLGLAKVAPQQRSVLGMQVSTGGQARFGTWDYMAPEQWIRAKDVGPKADVYSLGVLMYQMLSGELPFVANDAKNLMRMHLFVNAPTERLRGTCARPLFTLVDRMLRKTAKERPSMTEVVERLDVVSMEKAGGRKHADQ